MIPLPLPSIKNSLLDSSRPLNKSLGKQKAILSMPMCPSLARIELGVFCPCPSRQGARQSSRAITLQIFSDFMSCQFCQTSVLQMAKHSLTQRLLKAAERSDWGWKNHWFGSIFYWYWWYEEMRPKLEVTGAEVCRCPNPPLGFLPWRSLCVSRKGKSAWEGIVCHHGGWVSSRLNFSSFPFKMLGKKSNN